MERLLWRGRGRRNTALAGWMVGCSARCHMSVWSHCIAAPAAQARVRRQQVLGQGLQVTCRETGRGSSSSFCFCRLLTYTVTLTGAEKSEMRTSCMTMTANVEHSSTFNHDDEDVEAFIIPSLTSAGIFEK